MKTLGLGRLRMGGLAGLLAGLLACGSTEPGGAGGGGAGGGTVPVDLVGSWYNGTVSPINYYDPGSGQWSNGYGEGMFYTFKADGTFEFGYEVQAGAYGCTNTHMWYKSGRVVSDSATQTVTVQPHVALLDSKDNCQAKNNYEKPIDPSAEQLGWHFGKDAYGYDALLLDFSTGEEIAFYRWTP
jgi:hypothetical protein